MNIKYIQNKKIIQSKIGDEVVMMDIDSGFYFGLNSVASFIWGKLEKESSLEDIISDLLMVYNVDRLTSENETRNFLELLLEKDIIKMIS
jgi:hypothetical protein